MRAFYADRSRVGRSYRLMLTHFLDSVTYYYLVSHWALATGLEVVVVGCLWIVQCLFASRESFGI